MRTIMAAPVRVVFPCTSVYVLLFDFYAFPASSAEREGINYSIEDIKWTRSSGEDRQEFRL